MFCVFTGEGQKGEAVLVGFINFGEVYPPF